MATLKEFLRVVELALKDKTSGPRMKEIRQVLKKHDAFKGLSPEKATAILEDLGPTFVKLGQIASNRGDILPKEYCDSFIKLRTKVPPVDFETVLSRIEDSLGTPWKDVFEYIEGTPLGSASIAQVHRAKLLDGNIVAIKVRRPGIDETMAEDIMLMKRIIALADFSTTSYDGIILSLDNLINELERTTVEELDFHVELDNLVCFYEDTKDQIGISSPLPYPKYSTDKVLVMEFVTGTLVNDIEKTEANASKLQSIGERLAQSYVTQIIDNGFFHADPHPGNILIKNNEIIWIDLGMVGRLTEGEKLLMSKIFISITTNDAYGLKDSLLALSKGGTQVDHGLLLDQMDAMLAGYASSKLSDINIGSAFSDVVEILRRQNLSLPPSFTMLARGLLTLEGVLSQIAPEINIIDIVSKHAKKQLLNPQSFVAKVQELSFTGLKSAEASVELPAQLGHSLSMLNRGALKITMNMKASEDLLGSFYTVAGRLSLSLISAGLFVGSSILCTTNLKPQFLGVPFLGFLGYVGAFVLGVYVIWRTFIGRHMFGGGKKPK